MEARGVVRVSGPFTKGRVIDLSLAAAKELRMTGRGPVKVTAALQ
jgi:rare lipoprotein A (peptidoglycan hydrolase)